MTHMTIHPNCKINLGLNIIERRPDGYHNIETVFYPVPLCDALSVETAESDRLETTGIPVAGSPEDNLVMKVVNLLRGEGFEIPPLRIRLEKNIPSGAGLGGGSSDAAAMMRLLNEMFHLGMDDDKMCRLIVRLGADCPFFIINRPVLAKGIGDRIKPIALSLSGWHLSLIKPDVFVSTKEAYSSVVPRKPERPIEEVLREPVDTWKEGLTNDFEASVFALHPSIGHIKEELYARGAFYAAMSGSGSSLFALSRVPININEGFEGCFRFHSQL